MRTSHGMADTVRPYSIGAAAMSDTQACLCGGTEFQRVVIERPGQPYTTAFLACKRCGVMYHVPIRPGAWGAPPVAPTTPKSRPS